MNSGLSWGEDPAWASGRSNSLTLLGQNKWLYGGFPKIQACVKCMLLQTMIGVSEDSAMESWMQSSGCMTLLHGTTQKSDKLGFVCMGLLLPRSQVLPLSSVVPRNRTSRLSDRTCAQTQSVVAQRLCSSHESTLSFKLGDGRGRDPPEIYRNQDVPHRP